MQDITVYHNPQCSNSRGAVALLEAAGYTPKTIEYLKSPPDAPILEDLIARSERGAADFVRFKEAEATAQGLSPKHDATTLIAALAATPQLLQRPIVDLGTTVVIARPPETLAPYLTSDAK